jgi:hypothetical protein
MNATAEWPNELDPPNWLTFVEWLSDFGRVFPFIPHEQAPQRASWSLGATYMQTLENYKRAEAPFVPQIEDVIRGFCTTRHASVKSVALAYFLGLRPIILLFFLSKFTIQPGPDRYVSIIPFPSLPPPHVAQWFLIDWWRAWGPRETASRRLQDRFFS